VADLGSVADARSNFRPRHSVGSDVPERYSDVAGAGPHGRGQAVYARTQMGSTYRTNRRPNGFTDDFRGTHNVMVMLPIYEVCSC